MGGWLGQVYFQWDSSVSCLPQKLLGQERGQTGHSSASTPANPPWRWEWILCRVFTSSHTSVCLTVLLKRRMAHYGARTFRAEFTSSHSSLLSSLTFFFFFVVLGLELRAYTLNHSTSHFLWWFFSRQGLTNYLPRLASNVNPPHIYFLSSWSYRREPPAPGFFLSGTGDQTQGLRHTR
jgi:hypothetical protein